MGRAKGLFLKCYSVTFLIISNRGDLVGLSKTVLDSDFAALLADFDDGGTLDGVGADDGVTYNRISMTTKQTEYLRGRYGEEYQLTLGLQLSSVAVEPLEGDTVTFNSVEYRVMGTEKSPDTVAIHIHLGAEFGRQGRRG